MLKLLSKSTNVMVRIIWRGPSKHNMKHGVDVIECISVVCKEECGYLGDIRKHKAIIKRLTFVLSF